MNLKSILILDDSFPLDEMGSLAHGTYDAVLCLFWTATETIVHLEQQTGAQCIRLKDIVENVSDWEREATEAAVSLCDRGPRWRGIAWRSYLRQALYQELLYWFLAKRTLGFVRHLVGAYDETIAVDLAVAPRLAAAFQAQNDGTPPVFRFTHSVPISTAAPLPRWSRVLGRVREAILVGGWWLKAWQLGAELDREYKWRASYRGLIPDTTPVHAITFFSSYFNNSRTQKVFANYLTAPMQWVLTNWSARQGAEPKKYPTAWLWQFAPAHLPADLPTDDLPTTGERGLDEWLGVSQVWQNWLGFEMRALARLTLCWENFLESSKPRLIVTASAWGLDGWVSQVAQTHGIPTLQLLHGALGGYFYTHTPIESDVLVVWGEFWRQLMASREQEKIFVFCPPELFARVEKRPSPRRRLTFFSWDTVSLPQYSASELTNGIHGVLRELAQNDNVQITIRLHPAENPNELIQYWQGKYGGLRPNLRLSKHEPLDEILAETDVALMFRSTVMMNCLRNEIPVVMPGWIDFAWNDQLMGHAGIYLAMGLADLKERLFAELEHGSQVDPQLSEWFVASERDPDDFYEMVERKIQQEQLIAG